MFDYIVTFVTCPSIYLQIKLTKARSSFYLMKRLQIQKLLLNSSTQKLCKTYQIGPEVLLARHSTVSKGGIARYNMTRVELTTFTFYNGSKCLSIDNAVLGHIHKRLFSTMVKNTDFLGSLDINPYNFRHYDRSNFILFVNGKQLPNECLSLGMDHEKFCHGIQDNLGGIWHTSLKFGCSDNTRYV